MRNPAEPDPASQRNTDRCHQSEPECIPAQAREPEQKRVNLRLCRGAHADCSLYFTDGILKNPVLSNAQYVNAKRHSEKNRVMYRNNKNMIKKMVDKNIYHLFYMQNKIQNKLTQHIPWNIISN